MVFAATFLCNHQHETLELMIPRQYKTAGRYHLRNRICDKIYISELLNPQIPHANYS